jgi:hypothetical protein
MALGNNSGNSPKIYLSVGFGKLRQKQLENKQKVDKDTPGAIKRLTQQGAETWALEYDFVEGLIENIFFKEDTEYGNSFEVVVRDAADLYQISFTEESRYCIEFLKRLPNINLTKSVKLMVYDFVNKEGKRNSGVSIEQEGLPGDTIKVQSFYSRQKEDKTYENINGFPVPKKDINWKDKDDVKIYFIDVKKFLRSEFNRLFEDKFKSTTHMPDKVQEMTESENNGSDDLPF